MRTFQLTCDEQIVADEFEEKHKHKDVDHVSIGGHLTYSFTITSIGLCTVIKCHDCGEEKDVTDYEGW